MHLVTHTFITGEELNLTEVELIVLGESFCHQYLGGVEGHIPGLVSQPCAFITREHCVKHSCRICRPGSIGDFKIFRHSEEPQLW